MTRSQHKAELLELLRKPLLTKAQLDRLIAKAMAPRPLLPTAKWYITLWRICWDAVTSVVYGTILGVGLALLFEYWGFVS